MPRNAHCSRGSLRVETTGEPVIVQVCHCLECQRRTGSSYGAGAYFDAAQVRAEGDNRIFMRDAQQGRKVRFHFCPICGVSVYWEADRAPGIIGIAVGAFADPSFPAPSRSIYEVSRHSWVEFGHDLAHSPQGVAVRNRESVPRSG